MNIKLTTPSLFSVFCPQEPPKGDTHVQGVGALVLQPPGTFPPIGILPAAWFLPAPLLRETDHALEHHNEHLPKAETIFLHRAYGGASIEDKGREQA